MSKRLPMMKPVQGTQKYENWQKNLKAPDGRFFI